jgi:hypothetical protein
MFSLERWGGFHWYLALVLGALGYWSVRYTGYLVSERRYIKRKMQEAREAAGGQNCHNDGSFRFPNGEHCDGEDDLLASFRKSGERGGTA